MKYIYIYYSIYTFISFEIVSQGSVNCIWIRIDTSDKVNTKEIHFPTFS